MYHYYDEKTGQFEPNIRVHNFDKTYERNLSNRRRKERN
jgi:hypothetical protein